MVGPAGVTKLSEKSPVFHFNRLGSYAKCVIKLKPPYLLKLLVIFLWNLAFIFLEIRKIAAKRNQKWAPFSNDVIKKFSYHLWSMYRCYWLQKFFWAFIITRQITFLRTIQWGIKGHVTRQYVILYHFMKTMSFICNVNQGVLSPPPTHTFFSDRFSQPLWCNFASFVFTWNKLCSPPHTFTPVSPALP